jgi:hypothetical protein
MKTSDLDGEGVVAAWNALYPVGTPVQYWKGIRLGEGRTGVTCSAATLRGGHTPVVKIDSVFGAVALSNIEVVVPRVVAPCDICRHPKEGHGIRYVAIHGEHDWRDPFSHTAALRSSRPPEPTEPEPCSCTPNEFCQRCDPWREQRPATVPADPARPVRFSHIASAARRPA